MIIRYCLVFILKKGISFSGNEASLYSIWAKNLQTGKAIQIELWVNYKLNCPLGMITKLAVFCLMMFIGVLWIK